MAGYGNRTSYAGFDSFVLVHTQSERDHEGNLSHRVCSLEMVANTAKGKSQKLSVMTKAM